MKLDNTINLPLRSDCYGTTSVCYIMSFQCVGTNVIKRVHLLVFAALLVVVTDLDD